MAGRPKHYEEKELVGNALKVFWSKGYTAASTQDLMQAMDIGQGSFYRTFPGGKRELYQKSLKLQLENTIRKFNEKLAQSEQPVQYIKDFFVAIANKSQEGINNGCFFGNTLVEMSNLDEETKTISTNLLIKMKNGLEKAISKAQASGSIENKASADSIALYLLNLWNGLNVTQRAYPNKEQISELIKLNLKVLE